MSRTTEFAVLKQMEQPTLTIRTRTKVQELPKLIGESYCKIAQYLKELDETVTDVPFVCYHNQDMQNLDVEIGFPVSKALPPKEEIKPCSIAEGYLVFCIYRGPYYKMGPVYGKMAKWIDENGYEALGTAYEYYFNGPKCPKRDLLTKIVMPVKRK